MSRANPSYEMVILVVEDEFLIRDNVVHSLRGAGCLVLEAHSGEQAVEMLHPEQPIDVVFTDIRLSGTMSGWDVGEACRTKWNDISVIYTSGQEISSARSVPGSMFLRKPYRPEQVLDVCRRLCSGDRGSRSSPAIRGIGS